ncbi:MAG TPA: putative Ig domain-containing protein [Phycisphaerae bacterium]|nr:putative Ig domain-containing protein [Phycisphaerae bacterium]
MTKSSLLLTATLLAASPASADQLPLTDAGAQNLPPSAHATPAGITADVPSTILLNLAGHATRFNASFAIDPDSPDASAAIAISADGRRLAIAPVPPAASAPARGNRRFTPPMLTLRSGAPAFPVDIDVSNVRVLVIETLRAGNNPAHVDISNAAITYTGTKPQIAPPQKDDPIILTPPAPATPRINGAAIFGVRPTHPILYTIAATGDRPMTFSADNLPQGASLDPNTGMLSGAVSTPGQYKITLHVKNAKGETSRPFTLAVGDTIALTPQLGWNSWNCFGSSVTADKVKAAADAMVSSGLINHGFAYVNIDDFWEKNARMAGRDDTMKGDPRDAAGNILPNARFPDMKALTDYIHSKGLKAGLYSSPGPTTCGGCTGSYQHEEQDVQSWDKWGFDYIKYDLCSYTQTPEGRANPPGRSPENAKMPYAILGDALKKTDRDIFYSLCQYGQQDVGAWAPSVGGNSWRTTGDISGRWSSLTNIIDLQVGREKYAGPGHWNDPDMLVVGKTAIGNGNNPTAGLTPNEMYTHISMWCLLDAPLLIGCDMTKMDAFTTSLLSNDEVLAVNQDPLGRQASRILVDNDIQVWAKDLADGSKAVGIFNRSELEQPYTLKFSDLKLTGKQTPRDLWRQQNLAPASDDLTTPVPRHGVVLLRLIPVK